MFVDFYVFLRGFDERIDLGVNQFCSRSPTRSMETHGARPPCASRAPARRRGTEGEGDRKSAQNGSGHANEEGPRGPESLEPPGSMFKPRREPRQFSGPNSGVWRPFGAIPESPDPLDRSLTVPGPKTSSRGPMRRKNPPNLQVRRFDPRGSNLDVNPRCLKEGDEDDHDDDDDAGGGDDDDDNDNDNDNDHLANMGCNKQL